MSIVEKILGIGTKTVESLAEKTVVKPSFRIGGFQTMGAYTRAKDTRTKEELMANIDYFASRNPEVAKFKNELKTMNPKHLALASDICELGNTSEMLHTNIRLGDIKMQDGTNVFAYLMEMLPKASKENPKVLDFAQEVINQTDNSASKYFLASSAKLLEHPELGHQLEATQPLVKDIAESALKGGYTMDLSKERNFVNALSGYVNPSVNPEKIKIMPEIIKVADSVPLDDLVVQIDSFPFLNEATPMSKIRENLEVFPQVAENFVKQGGKEINITDFLTHNTNLY